MRLCRVLVIGVALVTGLPLTVEQRSRLSAFSEAMGPELLRGASAPRRQLSPTPDQGSQRLLVSYKLAPARLAGFRHLVSAPQPPDDGLEQLEANVVVRNTVLTNVLAQFGGALDASFSLGGQSSQKRSARAQEGEARNQTAARTLGAHYLIGLHMEILEPPPFVSAAMLKEMLAADPLVEGVWRDEVLEGQAEPSDFYEDDELDDLLVDDRDVVEDPEYEDYDTKAAFRSLPMVNSVMRHSLSAISETFIPESAPLMEHITDYAETTASATSALDSRPNDKYYKHQWAHHRRAGVQSERGWASWTGQDTNYVVALIDSGVDIDHPDLKTQFWRNTGETDCFNGIDDDGNGYVDDCIGWDWVEGDNLPQDENGHGTASAGIIAAVPNNQIGITGLCWGCKLMVLRTLDRDIRGTISGFVRAIDYAVLHGARLSNNSYGGRGSSYAALQTAVRRARQAGMLFVAAAGNYGSNNDFAQPTFPASYNESNILSVAASDASGNLAGFSCYGRNSVHLAAPGVNILSTTLNKKYAQVDGTSFATPYVTGVAALILSREPYLSYQEVVRRIMSTVTPSPTLKDRLRSGGILNMGAALAEGQSGLPVRAAPTHTCQANACPAHSECLITHAGLRCRCHPHYRHMAGKCVAACSSDIECGRHEFCNTATKACECQVGFARNAAGCYDQNECVHRDVCPAESICVNSPGGFDCLCPDGFLWNGVPWVHGGALCQPMRKPVAQISRSP